MSVQLSTHDKIAARAVPMRVIVCGVHRTGTLSTRAALKILGFSDCYHMVSVFQNIETDPQKWTRAIQAKFAGKGPVFTKDDWDRVLGQSQSLCDLPAVLFATDIAEIYPDAKVVILNRDPEKWYDSVLNTIDRLADFSVIKTSRLIYCLLFDFRFRGYFQFVGQLWGTALGFKHGKEKEKALAWFKRTYDEFREKIPAERRIEWTVTEGWAPLCKHLGVPIPMQKDEKTGEMVEVPFPRLNDRESFNQEASKTIDLAVARSNQRVFALIGRATVLAGIGLFAWKQYINRR